MSAPQNLETNPFPADADGYLTVVPPLETEATPFSLLDNAVDLQLLPSVGRVVRDETHNWIVSHQVRAAVAARRLQRNGPRRKEHARPAHHMKPVEVTPDELASYDLSLRPSDWKQIDIQAEAA